MADKTKAKRKTNKPAHQRYNTKGQREINKARRILRCNGEKFLLKWKLLPKKAQKKHHK